MNRLVKSACAATLALLITPLVMANAKLDTLLSKIDADISASRLSSPVGNNAIEGIWQFKAIAPYDQRINTRVYKVGEFYVKLANKAISTKQYDKAQGYLDKAWMVAYLTPGLETAQDKLDAVYSGGQSTAAAAPQPAPQKAKATPAAPKKAAPKKDNSKAAKAKADKEKAAKAKAAKRAQEAKRKKQIAAEKAAAEKARKLAKEKAALEKQLAEKSREEEARRAEVAKLTALKAQQAKAAEALKNAKEDSKPIAQFSLDQGIIDERSSSDIRKALEPVCKEVLDNEASVVLHTRTPQDYRWLTVRLTLCVRRIDREFRLRHSNQIVSNGSPKITLHPGRSMSLLNAE